MKFKQEFTRVDELPLMLKTDDIARLMRCTVEHARKLCRDGFFTDADDKSGQWLVPRRSIIEQLKL